MVVDYLQCLSDGFTAIKYLQSTELAINSPPNTTPTAKFSQHQWWDEGSGWKNILDNLRLIIQPMFSYVSSLPGFRFSQLLL
jgi:hypothetical protein